jgi:periplasmic protein TonB
MNTTQLEVAMNAVSYFAQPPLTKPPARTIPIAIAVLAHVVILIVMGKGLMVHFKPTPESVAEVVDVPPISQPEPTVIQPSNIPLQNSQITPVIPELIISEDPPETKTITTTERREPPPPTGGFVGEPEMTGAQISPHLIYQSEPPYPEASRRSGEEGLVKLLITITPNGRVTNAQVQESSGSKRLDQAAIEAVRSWKYSPAQRGGMSISETIPVLIRFSLK